VTTDPDEVAERDGLAPGLELVGVELPFVEGDLHLAAAVLEMTERQAAEAPPEDDAPGELHRLVVAPLRRVGRERVDRVAARRMERRGRDLVRIGGRLLAHRGTV
jgi:hypothetical protein